MVTSAAVDNGDRYDDGQQLSSGEGVWWAHSLTDLFLFHAGGAELQVC